MMLLLKVESEAGARWMAGCDTWLMVRGEAKLNEPRLGTCADDRREEIDASRPCRLLAAEDALASRRNASLKSRNDGARDGARVTGALLLTVRVYVSRGEVHRESGRLQTVMDQDGKEPRVRPDS